MDEQIIIKTDLAGLRLYATAQEGLEFYASHIDQLNNWYKAIEEIQTLSVVHQITTNPHLDNLKKIISVDSLLSRALSDLNLIASELYLAKIKLQQIYYIKQAYLLIYETYENFRKQQSFISELVNILGGEFQDEFKSWLQLKKSFFKKHQIETSVRTVRDKLAGHIELDFRLWYQTTIALDSSYTFNMIIDHSKVLEPLQRLSSKLVLHLKDLMDKQALEIRQNTNEIIDKIEKTLETVNERQPEGMKLDIDIEQLRKLNKSS